MCFGLALIDFAKYAKEKGHVNRHLLYEETVQAGVMTMSSKWRGTNCK